MALTSREYADIHQPLHAFMRDKNWCLGQGADGLVMGGAVASEWGDTIG